MSCDRLDAALIGGPYVLLDAHNSGVGIVGTSADARAAIARGDRGATTYAGRVHPAVTALDIDTTDHRLGSYLVDEVTSWAQRRGVWSLAAPSGGGPGRWHVFVLPDRFSAELVDLIGLLRSERRLSGRQLDIRHTIRPLGAPHRTGQPRPALEINPADLELVEAATHSRTANSRWSRPRRGDQDGDIVPIGTLTARGAATLAELPILRDDHGRADRSAREFELTRRLATAKERVENAWEAVRRLGGKAAQRGFAWWRRYMWDAVRSGNPATPHQEIPPVDLAPLVLPTLAANRARWEHWDTRRRHSLETVLWAVLERLTGRTGEWVPLSQRDIRLATGLDRKTIAARLNDAVAMQVLQRQQSAAADAADEWKPGTTAVSSLNPPPVLTPPAATWLPAAPAGSASTALDGHLTSSCSPPTSTRQTRLARARQNAVDQAAGAPTTRYCTRRQELLEEITAERDVFYAGLQAARLDRERCWWSDHRAAVAATHRRYRRWWDQLTAAEREARRQQAQDRWRCQDSPARSRWLTQRRRTDDLLRGRTPAVIALPATRFSGRRNALHADPHRAYGDSTGWASGTRSVEGTRDSNLAVAPLSDSSSRPDSAIALALL